MRRLASLPLQTSAVLCFFWPCLMVSLISWVTWSMIWLSKTASKIHLLCDMSILLSNGAALAACLYQNCLSESMPLMQVAKSKKQFDGGIRNMNASFPSIKIVQQEVIFTEPITGMFFSPRCSHFQQWVFSSLSMPGGCPTTALPLGAQVSRLEVAKSASILQTTAADLLVKAYSAGCLLLAERGQTI